MARYIDADKLLAESTISRTASNWDSCITVDDIDDCPTEDVVPVIHAHWVKAERRGCLVYHSSFKECSNCHGKPIQLIRNFNYCPDCGAKMDGE